MSTPTTPPERHPQRLAGPGQLVAFLPYQLGYHPRCSAVVVCWRDGRLGLVQRADLPEPGQEGEAAALLVPVLLRERPSAVTLIGFEEGASRGASAPVLELVAEECEAVGIELQDHLVVRSGRWRSLLARPGAAGDGEPVPPPERVPAVLAMITHGVDPAPSRERLEERLAGGRPLLERAIRAEAELLLDGLPGSDDPREVACWREDALFAWSRVLGGADPSGTEPVEALRPVDLARAAVALVDVQLRDALIAWLTPDNLPLDLVDPELMAQVRRRLWPVGDGSDPSGGAPGGPQDPLVERDEVDTRAREARLADFCRVLPAEWAVGPLTVLAAHAWWRGDGALARIALERALHTDPGYRLAELLLQLVDHGVRPEPRRQDRPPSDSAA